MTWFIPAPRPAEQPGLSDQPRPNRAFRAGRAVRVLEGAAVFVLGVAVMNYLYAATVTRPGDIIGAPEHDSYYHIAMASMLPEHGLMTKFPWLRFTWFRDQGDDFVSHHWGFHLLLLPFVKAGEWLNNDALAGGRWGISAYFGVNLLLFHLLLRQKGVPLHWLWIAFYLLLPEQFLVRHGFVRAIGASFMFMQLILLALFAGRYLLAGIALAGYVHLYLGAVMYGPVIVAAYAFSQVVGTKEQRRWPWRMVLITTGGWMLGVLTYPYFGGMFEFLRMQVFGSGLSPDIEVGVEWKPYTDAWYFVSMAGPLLLVWAAAITLRLRMGPSLDARETTLVVLNFVFLLLNLKARRFIEYWPPVCLLGAAYLAAPILQSGADAARARFAGIGHAGRKGLPSAAAIVVLAGLLATALFALVHRENTAVLIAEWRLWVFVSALLLLPALLGIWSSTAPDPERSTLGTAGARSIKVFLAGALALGLVLLAVRVYSGELPPARVRVPWIAWALLAAAYAIMPLVLIGRGPAEAGAPAFAFSPVSRTVAAVVLALILPAGTLAAGSPAFASAARQLRCRYDLRALRQMMGFLKENSRAGDVVFTDDWDTFPVFFYHNRHNHFIVGLDPKFTHQRDPVLWNRFVKITRGQVPSTITVGDKRVTVGVTDIRDHFGARFVIADRDHRRLAQALVEKPDLAEFIYPGTSYDNARDAEYVVFRIRDPGEPLAEAAAEEPADELYLSRVRPRSAMQGWGDLGADRSVENNPITLDGKAYHRGIGTHAPAELVYDVPPGFARFEAIVGVDDETHQRGSAVVSVELDGRQAYRSAVLRGGGEPATIGIPLNGARQITLRADPTPDGQRFDHVSWADARLLRDSAGATTAPANAPSGAKPGATTRSAPPAEGESAGSDSRKAPPPR